LVLAQRAFVGLQRRDWSRLGFSWIDGSMLETNFNRSQWGEDQPREGTEDDCVVFDQYINKLFTSSCFNNDAGYICQTYAISETGKMNYIL